LVIMNANNYQPTSINNKMKKSKKYLPYILLAFGLLCIGWSAVFVKLADVSGLVSGFYRMFIGAISIMPLWLLRHKSWKIDAGSFRIAVLCGVLFACDIALWNTSIMLSKAAIATLLANMAPVWVGLGSYFILKEKAGRNFWIGCIISIIGVSLITGITSISASMFSWGAILAIMASFFYAAYLLITPRVRGKVDTISFTAVSMIASSVVLLIFCMVSESKLTGYSTKSWMALAGLGFVSQFLGWIAINWALAYINSTTASVTLLSQSIVTAIIAIPVLGETLSFIEIIGAIVVLTGIFLVIKKQKASKTEILPEYE